MRNIVAGFALAAASLVAQPRSPLLLPSARHIVGVVLDEQGNPIEGASVDHTDPSRSDRTATDSAGKFDLWIDAPSFVIRKAGYHGLLVQTANLGAPELRFVLQKSAARLRVCSGGEIPDDVYGYRISFEFPKLPGIEEASGRDVDYSTRSYYINTANGPKGIQHGQGAMWSFGVPLDDNVWRSVSYEDISFRAGRITIVDARGQYANGGRWRFLGKFGETASYEDVDEKTAAILDRVLDGGCLKLGPEL